MDAAASVIVVYRPVVRRSEERWEEQGWVGVLDYAPGKPLGFSRYSRGCWRGPSLARVLGIHPEYRDRAALLDAIIAASDARGVPVIIRASRRADLTAGLNAA